MAVLELYDNSDQLSETELRDLGEKLRRALPLILKKPGDVESALVLSDLELVEISIVDDETIGRVHGEFMDDPTPTDVITFQHGEILVSVDTAKAVVASGAGEASLMSELELYAIHGLLHLHGYDDLSEPARTAMHARQVEILELGKIAN